MPIYVHVTDTCERDATRHGQTSLLANIKKQVEASQCLIGFDFLPPTPFLKKALKRSFRLIGCRVTFGSDELILFLRVLARGGKEYEDFLANWDKEPDRLSQQFQPYDEAQLRKIYADLAAEPRVEPPPVPSDEERAWLYEVFRGEDTTDELLILETDAWVRRMRAAETREFLALYHQAVEQLDPTHLAPASSNTDCHVHWEKNNKRVGIAYLYRPDLNRLLLLEPLRQGDNVDDVLTSHRARLARVGDTAHELSRVAGRSYPYLMVLDQGAWLAIQKDEEANLALSPEEAELLESVRKTGAEGELGYPLFINGRAGSGKSTMLQYLAANYVNFALRRGTALLPIYMTCSRDLLERARETVRGLLTAHYEQLLNGAPYPARIEPILKKSFVVFHEFLYSLLEPAMRERFAPERRVTYAEFWQLWANDFGKRPEAKHMSPAVAWHTIRSYIKGIRSTQDDELGPEEFAALPRRRRSVSVETYRQVYERVWCSWYKRLCDEERYWDDQDLAAWVLNSGTARASDFAAVFCDEAQDFTPLELDIIFQLSVYAKRSLLPEELRRVPIVFAGDPLQTINPTGFRWDAVQADFHERFCAVLDPRRRARLEISYRELRFNYRSNPGIVRFCNLIQLVRATLLGGRDVRPQEAWWVDEPAQTVWFAVDNAFTKQQLQQRPDLVKLVNCEEGEESTYVRADSILSGLREESDGVFRNVLGPARSKGLEFPAVVVYRFAETAPSDFLRLLTGELDVRDDPDQQLPFEYFFNRLYVAASRAKGQLVVVDSSSAFDGFWRFATDPDVVDRLTKQTKEPQVWKDSITFLVRGREESWSGERIDPREQGAEYATQGRRNRDPYLMRQAALAYRSASDEIEAVRCLAQAAEFEGKLCDAGDRYRDSGFLDEAFRCYWQSQQFEKICDLASKDAAYASRLKSRAADFVARSGGDVAPTFLSEILKAASDPSWRAEATKDTTWNLVLAKLAERLARSNGDKTVPWREVYETFSQLKDGGLELPEPHLALIAYTAGEYAVAIEIWERVGETDSKPYLEAKARQEPFPENIVWFCRLKEWKTVLAEWHKHRASVTDLGALEDAVVFAVIDAAVETGDLRLAGELLVAKPNRERVEALLAAAAKRNEEATLLAAARAAVRVLVKSGSWAAVVNVAENADFGELAKGMHNEAKQVLRRSDILAQLLRETVEELARSPELATESADRQGPVREFLHRTFISKGVATGSYGLRPEVVGAAIERAGKIVDALQYYENLERNPATPEDLKRFAAERQVRNHERLAKHFRERGDENQARERETRAKKLREIWHLGERQLPDYPELPAMSGVGGHPEWVRGPFKFVLNRAYGRVRIEHGPRFETVTVYAQERVLRGDACFVPLDQADACAWKLPDWSMTIELRDAPNGYIVCCQFSGECFKVQVEKTSQSR